MATQTQPQTRATWVLDPSHSTAEFAVKHMVISTVKGRFSKLQATVDFDEAHPDRSSVEAQIEVASVDTREERRDAHLRSADFFDAEKFPTMTFKSRRIEPLGKSRYSVIGDFTVHGVTRELVLDTEFGGIGKDPWGGQRAGFTAEATVNRKDFGLTWNVALETGGLLVGDTVKLTIEAELVKQK